MTWRYPEPRALCSVYVIPVPFTTFTSYPSPVKEEDRIVSSVLQGEQRSLHLENIFHKIFHNDPPRYERLGSY